MVILVKKNVILNCIRTYCKDSSTIMKYLCVAEKNDAAKNIAGQLSRGSSQRREGLSTFNKIYEFNCTVFGQQAQLVMTSVSGHLMNYEFDQNYRKWYSCNPVDLFDAPIQKYCMANFEKIKKTLEREVRSCQGLIVWTDCDREGENIGFEVIDVCTKAKPNIDVYRAKFSEITAASVFRALNNLERPNKNVSDAVDVRQELDLRTGAAFTRLQTIRLTKVFPNQLDKKLISYGSCQFPTLGFVVERYQGIENFIPERFWKIKMNHTVKDLTTEFSWKRERLFEKNAVQAIVDICQERGNATVDSVESKPKSKWRPLPLDTVEMEKSISRSLRINAKEVMKIAEKLYTQGFISYPRTETNIFPKELNLTNLVEQQRGDERWGPFANRILNEGGPNPRQGRKSDQAHPPIHPIKYTNALQGNEQRVYEFIVRHFLACVHKDALGHETTIIADIADEKFIAKGLLILERNYLDVYFYQKWNAKEVNQYAMGDTFIPTVLEMAEGSTSPPKLLTEADLIALMEKHGIGTDATHAEHIETIKTREYVGLHENVYFVPQTLGMGLVEGYNKIGLEISLAKPNLRSDFENDLKLICEGKKNPEIVRVEQIRKYKEAFKIVAEKMRLIDATLATRLNDQPAAYEPSTILPNTAKTIMKCPKCGGNMTLRRRQNQGYFIGCTSYPNCKNAIWFDSNVVNMEATEETCTYCRPDVFKLKMQFKQNPFFGEQNPITLCIGGCDDSILSILNIPLSSVRNQNNQPANRTSVNNNSTVQTNTTLSNSSSYQRNTNNSTSVNSGNSAGFNNRNNTNMGRNSNQNVNILPPTIMLNNQASTSFNNHNASMPNSEEIVCHCNIQPILLTVKKDGPNKGKNFYKCANSNCDFFLWAANEEQNNSRNRRDDDDDDNDQNGVKCECLLPVVERTVFKDGPNKGRKFKSCSQPKDRACNFFQWMDEPSRNSNNNSSFNNRPAKKFKGKAATKTSVTKMPYGRKERASRKCGHCRQEGHRQNKCPNK